LRNPFYVVLRIIPTKYTGLDFLVSFWAMQKEIPGAGTAQELGMIVSFI
jgi:hypothetical protein